MPFGVCPRAGCTNVLAGPEQIVCTGDFTALAGMCRGKKRLGEPQAASIQSAGYGQAYRCALCRQWHTGARPARLEQLVAGAQAVVAALHADPRVGWRGVLQLADAWERTRVNRSRWHEGLDQRAALTAP